MDLKQKKKSGKYETNINVFNRSELEYHFALKKIIF